MSALSGKRLSLLALTHRTAPIEVRERLALSDTQAKRLYADLRAMPGVSECVVLPTCNRIEIYTVSDAAMPAGRELSALATIHEVDEEFVKAHASDVSGVAAVGHLFEVAAGLDSQMIGEAEILGQVKDAYADALAGEATGPALNRIFQKGFQAAAWARTHTGIGRGEVSIGNVAVELARRIFGELKDSRVLVLGTGEVGEKTAKSFVSRGVTDITVASRTFENAHRLAATFGGAAIELKDALVRAGHYDIVIGAASVEEPLLDAFRMKVASQHRRGDPAFLIDLGLPRNFSSEIAALDGVFLYNLDDLSAIANENLRARMAEVDKARAALLERAGRVWAATGMA